MRAGGLTAAFFGIVGDAKLLTLGAKGIVVSDQTLSEGEAWADSEKQLNGFDELANRASIGLATSTVHIEQLRQRGQITTFLSCAGGHGIEGRLHRLDDLYGRGVRSPQLVHYAQNTLGMCGLYRRSTTGCPPSGRDVVRRMNRLRMVVGRCARLVPYGQSHTRHHYRPNNAIALASSKRYFSTSLPHHGRARAVGFLYWRVDRRLALWLANRTVADFLDRTMRLIDAVGIDHVSLGPIWTEISNRCFLVIGNCRTGWEDYVPRVYPKLI
jgi:membrane dipeptidase